MPATDGDDSSRAGASDLKGVHVLVVEDDWTLATAVKRLLDNVGMNVIGSAATVAQAEGFLAERVPDAAVVDVNLKGEMTYGLIDRLRDSGVGVVVISGYAEVDTEAAAAILQKPFERDELLAALRQVMAQQRGR